MVALHGPCNSPDFLALPRVTHNSHTKGVPVNIPDHLMHYLVTEQLSQCSGLDSAPWEALLFVTHTLYDNLLLIVCMILVIFSKHAQG